jgi:AbrB family looped-hinge helix DNA binding protein
MVQAVLRRQGNSLGVTIPAETRIRLGLEEGQVVEVIETENAVTFVKSDQTMSRFIAAAGRQIERQRDVTARLARYDETGVLPKKRP